MTPGNPLAVCGAELLLRGGGAEAAIAECAMSSLSSCAVCLAGEKALATS